jgi:hypothetical protein
MAGQIIKRGESTWLVRVFLGRDAPTGKRQYHNKTIHGTKKDAPTYLNGSLSNRDKGIFSEHSKITVGVLLDGLLLDYHVNGKHHSHGGSVFRGGLPGRRVLERNRPTRSGI